MPVLVADPASTVGQATVRRLAATGGEIRAFCGPQAPLHQFRQMGVVCASGSLLDEAHLETAMEQVHTVIYLGVDPLAPSAERVVEEAATVVSAATGAGVRRLVVLSVPGAAADAADPLRTAAAEVETLIAAAPSDAAAVRVSLVDSPELRSALSRTPLDHDTLDVAVAPVRPVDLAELLYGLDERRDLHGHLLFAADGPVTTTLRAHLRDTGVTPLSAVGRVVGRLRATDHPLLAPALSAPWVSDGDLPSGWTLTGVRPRAPSEAASRKGGAG